MLQIRVGITRTSVRLSWVYFDIYNGLALKSKNTYQNTVQTQSHIISYESHNNSLTIRHSFTMFLSIHHTIHSSTTPFIHHTIHHHSFITTFMHSSQHSLIHPFTHSFSHSLIQHTNHIKTFHKRLHTSACCGEHFAAQIIVNPFTCSRACSAL